MRKNVDTRVTGTNVVLVPYREKHVAKFVSFVNLFSFFFLLFFFLLPFEMRNGIIQVSRMDEMPDAAVPDKFRTADAGAGVRNAKTLARGRR